MFLGPNLSPDILQTLCDRRVALNNSLFVLLACLCFLSWLNSAVAQENQKAASGPEKARIFVTDSQSWSVAGQGGGTGGSYGSTTHGGARPQTAEIIKTFGERCPQVMINNIQTKTDYIVLLDHEGGKGALRHKNKVAVFQKVSGDIVVSHSTLSLGGSVQDACEGITNDWSIHAAQIRTSTAKAAAPPPAAPVVVEVA